MPFPELPHIDVTQLQFARHKLVQDVTQQWDGNYKGRICSSTVVTESYGNLTASAVIELENEYQRLQQDYQLFKDRMSLFSNHSNVVHEETRQKRQVNVLLAAGAALILGPKLEAAGCKLFSIFGFCKSKEARHIEKLHEENQRNKWNVDWLNTQTGGAVKILSAEELATRTRVETIRNNTDRNLDLLVTQNNEMGKEWGRMSGWGCKITQAYRDGLKVTLQIENLLGIISELQGQVLFARAIVTNLGYVLSDALVSLTEGLIPASLLPPPQIRDIVSKMEQTGWFPAISKSEMSAYYEFELVKSAQITSQGLHIELEIPFHHTYAKYQVYRTVAIPQPLNSGKTATVYDFQKEYFVVSPRQEFFGELDRSELVKCHGTDRLRFCKNPFALTRSAKSSCLSSLFFDQKTDAMKLCPQKIIPLPANPISSIPEAVYISSSVGKQQLSSS